MSMSTTHSQPTVTDRTLDAKADAIVDLAMSAVRLHLRRDELDATRTAIQDAVDALIDECRAYYTSEAFRR